MLPYNILQNNTRGGAESLNPALFKCRRRVPLNLHIYLSVITSHSQSIAMETQLAFPAIRHWHRVNPQSENQFFWKSYKGRRQNVLAMQGFSNPAQPSVKCFQRWLKTLNPAFLSSIQASLFWINQQREISFRPIVGLWYSPRASEAFSHLSAFEKIPIAV